MELFLFWFIFSIIVGVAAGNRGRSALGWFFVAMIITPVLALVLVLVIPRIETLDQRLARLRSSGAPTPDTHVKCPDCAELVLREAKICKHCGCRLIPQVDVQTLVAEQRPGPGEMV